MTIERAEIPERRPHGFGSERQDRDPLPDGHADHLCPFGLKSKDLIERQGSAVEDHQLTTRDETEAFKKEHGVETTPQTFIGGDRIGGYDDLRAHFGQEVKDADETSYKPVIAILSVAFLMALAVSWYTFGTVFSIRAVEWFIAISMCILAIQKLLDIESFSTMFLNYDLLARRWERHTSIPSAKRWPVS